MASNAKNGSGYQGGCFGVTTSRLLRAQCVLLLGLSTVFWLPRAGKSSPAGIAMALPRVVGEWIGDDTPVSQKERDVLAKDTEYARKIYFNLAGDQIFVSIVLSGEDMANSIHRPERCLPAQGLTVISSEKRVLTVGDDRQLELTELRTTRGAGSKDGDNGFRMLNYYWFIGYHDMTASHLKRTEIDLRDRILHGYNQRWAYVTVAAVVNRQSTGRPEDQTSAMIEQFIRELVPTLRKPNGESLL